MKRPNLGTPVPSKIAKAGTSTGVAKSAGVNIKSEAPVASKGGKIASSGSGIKGGKSNAVASVQSGVAMGAKVGALVGAKAEKIATAKEGAVDDEQSLMEAEAIVDAQAEGVAEASAGAQLGGSAGTPVGASSAMEAEADSEAEDVDDEAEDEEEDEDETEEEYEGEEIPHYPYVVRGARIFCQYGTHIRRLDMPAAHGAFIRDKAMMNEDDCKVGLDYNIAPFGGCHSPLNEGTRVDITIGPDEEPMPNDYDPDGFTEHDDGSITEGAFIFPEPGTVIKDVKLCEPDLGDKWLDAEKETLVDGKPALTMKCSIMCSYVCTAGEGDYEATGISFMDDGQMSS